MTMTYEEADINELDRCPHGQAYLCFDCGKAQAEAAGIEWDGVDVPVGEALRPGGARRPKRVQRPPLYLDKDGKPVYK
jgi:hypothetical protein